MKTGGFLSLLLTASTLFTAYEQGISTDYLAIREAVADRELYIDMVVSFEEGDSTLILQDIAVIYYGFGFQPEYQGDDNVDEQVFTRAFSNSNYKRVWNQRRHMMYNPVSLRMLRMLFISGEELGKDPAEIALYRKRYLDLISVIAVSGNGRTPGTAFKVLSVADALEFMATWLGIDGVVAAERVDFYDKYTVVPSEKYPFGEVWFNCALPHSKAATEVIL